MMVQCTLKKTCSSCCLLVDHSSGPEVSQKLTTYRTRYLPSSGLFQYDLKMEKVHQMVKDERIMKIEIPGDGSSTPEVCSGGLTRQTSITKTNCLCSPTTHPGSFRCRMHRSLSLQRTKSIEAAALQDAPAKPSDSLRATK
ncbi:PREDICTED: uncharacterized protein LOC106297064 isoform X1 [Brassica oleracea var. oleracea]|uniref:uncharacterized protein LOC106297064 isoform X1 n=1 Tax=Brassica oleracea var. oleracea TaxID=109376 RepID=UPI0006A6FC36|nr:PREDICTED: uncharacterized protein LOC106297064 isoform X1 [Brassica oleracea var. oleracea]